MTSIRRIDDTMGSEDSIATSPAKTDCADFAGGGIGADGGDEGFDEGFGDGFAVLEEPGREGRADCCGGFGFVD